MARLLTYNYLINKYIFNNKICKYNNSLPDKPKKFTFNTTDDVKNFIRYYHVKNHDFGDLSLADKIVINDGTYDKAWLIAGFNTQLDSDVNNGTFGKHHLTLIPKKYLTDGQMHSTNDNSQGFANTEMFNITLPNINNNLSNILQHHLLPHKMMLSIDNNSNMACFTVKSMLLNYVQAFGIDLPYQYYDYHFLASLEKYINNDIENGDDVFQFPLFKQDVKYRTVEYNEWWLRNAYAKHSFTSIFDDGTMDYTIASLWRFVRPFICLG